jgi:Ethanolamine utilization protein EutJ (predicted chaperonin)
MLRAEPAEVHLLHGRALGETGRKYRDPAKSAWELRTTKASDAVFGQVSQTCQTGAVDIMQSFELEVQWLIDDPTHRSDLHTLRGPDFGLEEHLCS